MSADIVKSNQGVDLFASFREVAWHGLGTVFTKTVTDYLEMLSLAGLAGWNMREEALTLPGVRFAKDHKIILADIGTETVALGVTGDSYGLVQNEDAFSFLQSLQDGARWETAGAIKGGRVVFGSMAFERNIVLDPKGVADKVESYLLLHTSHDGSTNVGGGVTPTRVVCKNTLNMALGNIAQTFKVRHSKNVAERMQAEAEMWRTAHTYMDAFEVEAQALFAKSVTDKQYFSIVETLFPEPENDVKGAVKKYERRMELYTQAWKGAPNAGIKNTGWGALNALTEANQWGRKIQKTANGLENFYAAGAGFDVPTNKFRNTALAMVQAV